MINEDNWLSDVSVKLALMTFGSRSTPPWEDIQPEQTWRKNNKRPKDNLVAGLVKTCSWGTNITALMSIAAPAAAGSWLSPRIYCLHEGILTHTPEVTQ